MINKGYLKGDIKAKIVDDASVEALAKKRNQTTVKQKQLNEITTDDDDSTIIVTTKGELKEAFRRWLHSQKRVTVEEILEIVA
ncbi:hypothetical protein [Hydrogenimonas urashimensis]|uniref:hypothetical protein n=1 Tax=Hydrogenimonas urashimensis TaxID=2740515 RepID=UPI0019164354|nr:hypothetical protein [Hydrogenimonas urashimensis]